LVFYAASKITLVPKFRENISVPSSRVSSPNLGLLDQALDYLTLEDWTDRLCRNVGKEVPFDVA